MHKLTSKIAIAAAITGGAIVFAARSVSRKKKSKYTRLTLDDITEPKSTLDITDTEPKSTLDITDTEPKRTLDITEQNKVSHNKHKSQKAETYEIKFSSSPRHGGWTKPTKVYEKNTVTCSLRKAKRLGRQMRRRHMHYADPNAKVTIWSVDKKLFIAKLKYDDFFIYQSY